MIVANIEDQENRDQDDDCVDNFRQEFRYGNAVPFLQVQFENVSINERDEKRRTEDDHCRAKMMQKSPGQREVQRRSVNSHAERQQMIQEAEPNAMFPFQPAPAQHQQAIQRRDGQGEEKAFVTLGQLRHDPYRSKSAE